MPDRPDSLDAMAAATGLRREEMLEIWADAKENQRRLDACVRHDFGPVETDPAKHGRLGMKYRCKNCQGTVDGHAFHWYGVGVKHGRADRRG